MIYRIVADIVVVIHFAYVSFVLLGLLATLVGWGLKWNWVRNRWFRGIHLTMIAIVVAESWAGITCPLTTWENEFRSAAGQNSYNGDFVAHWLHDAMFFDMSPWMFTVAYSLFGGLVLLTLFFVPPKWRKNIASDVDQNLSDQET